MTLRGKYPGGAVQFNRWQRNASKEKLPDGHVRFRPKADIQPKADIEVSAYLENRLNFTK